MKMDTPSRTYRKVARAEGEQRTRDALIDAAQTELFAGRWNQASLAAIAQSAGTTKQTLLRHFGSRDGLLIAGAERSQAQIREQRSRAPRDDVAGAVDNLLDHYEEWGGQALSIGSVAAGSGALADIPRTARQIHYDWVEHAFGLALDRFAPATRRRRRAALIALCDVNTWWLLSHDLGLARREVRATLIDTITTLIQEES